MNVPKIEAVGDESNGRLGVCFLCLICFWFYAYLSLVFSACYWWICLLVWSLYSFCFVLFFSPLFSFCECACVCYFLWFCLFSFAFNICFGVLSVHIFSFLFFQAMRPAGSWCSGQMSGLSLQGGRAESRTLDHQRPPGPKQYQLARALPEISISTLRQSSTQWPASSSAGGPMPNN